MERIQEQVADGRLLQLLESYLKAGVMESLKGWEPTEQGTPQGGVISPLMANLYLSPLDHQMAQRGYAMTRYADDLVIQCRSEAEAQRALEEVRRWAQENGLVVHPSKTRIVDATRPGGFDFLGYHFERGLRWPRQKSLDKLKSTVRARTRRTHGKSLPAIVAELNPTLRGWFGYFKHSHWTVMKDLDGWIRMRLRSILRKRRKGKGPGRGNDHVRWPNAFFERLGLFSLLRARDLAAQSR
jgi:RNA-directed DNA polymerase